MVSSGWGHTQHHNPLLKSYLQNNLVWVCPKRKRGLTYVTPTGLQSGDPSITGFLSYGFNEIGVFGGPDPATGLMSGNIQRFKSATVQRPADMVAICDTRVIHYTCNKNNNR